MLSALTKKGEMVHLTDELSRERLQRIRNTHTFYCPACHEKLILKIGHIIIPHFSHQKNKHCDVFSEGESTHHLKGKHLLYRWLQFQKIPVLIEPYLKAIHQRPDLLVQLNEKYIAVEFQCSTIAAKKLTQRNRGYRTLGIDVLWIPKARSDFYEGIQCVQLAPFYQQFIEQYQLMTLNVEREQLQFYMHLIHIAGRRYLTHAKKMNIHHQPFPLEIHTSFQVEETVTKWFHERERYITNRLRFNRRGIRDPFFKLCYEHKIIVQALPNWIGIPSSAHLSVHPLEWQLALVCLMQLNDVKDISLELYRLNRTWRVTTQAIEDYINFIKRENPTLLWQDIESNSIYEEFYRQSVALKFDN